MFLLCIYYVSNFWEIVRLFGLNVGLSDILGYIDCGCIHFIGFLLEATKDSCLMYTTLIQERLDSILNAPMFNNLEFYWSLSGFHIYIYIF